MNECTLHISCSEELKISSFSYSSYIAISINSCGHYGLDLLTFLLKSLVWPNVWEIPDFSTHPKRVMRNMPHGPEMQLEVSTNDLLILDVLILTQNLSLSYHGCPVCTASCLLTLFLDGSSNPKKPKHDFKSKNITRTWLMWRIGRVGRYLKRQQGAKRHVRRLDKDERWTELHAGFLG